MEDLRAVIAHARRHRGSLRALLRGRSRPRGGQARVCRVDRVAAYETPFIPEGSRPRPAPDVAGRLVSLVRACCDEATALFQTEVIGLPAEMVAGMRQSDMWGYLTGLAALAPYDYALFEAGSPAPAGLGSPR